MENCTVKICEEVLLPYNNQACFNNCDHKLERHVIPASLVSSFLSLTGSLLIIITYLVWKDIRRSVPRTIVFWLSVTDLLSSIAFILASIGHIVFKPGCFPKTLCTILSFFTAYFPKVSYLWTVYLALYFVVVLILRKAHLGRKLMVIFHITAWFTPLLVLVPIAATGWLGNGEYSEGPTWCWVSDSNFVNRTVAHFREEMNMYLIVETFAARIWQIGTILVILICYLMIFCLNRCRWRILQRRNQEAGFANQRISDALATIDIKLLLVPLAFILLRMWGVIRYFAFEVRPECTIPKRYNGSPDVMQGFCITQNCSGFYNPFLVGMQAFTIPLQGFFNAIIFVCLSKLILMRLVRCCYKHQAVSEPAKSNDDDTAMIEPSMTAHSTDEHQPLISSVSSYKKPSTILN